MARELFGRLGRLERTVDEMSERRWRRLDAQFGDFLRSLSAEEFATLCGAGDPDSERRNRRMRMLDKQREPSPPGNPGMSYEQRLREHARWVEEKDPAFVIMLEREGEAIKRRARELGYRP